MLKNLQFKVSGMHCNSCAQLVTMELADVDGITGVIVDPKSGMSTATLTDEKLTFADVAAAVERAGYSASIVEA